MFTPWFSSFGCPLHLNIGRRDFQRVTCGTIWISESTSFPGPLVFPSPGAREALRWETLGTRLFLSIYFCNVFFRLNSIWQAPTWSSLEYGGRWKVCGKNMGPTRFRVRAFLVPKWAGWYPNLFPRAFSPLSEFWCVQNCEWVKKSFWLWFFSARLTTASFMTVCVFFSSRCFIISRKTSTPRSLRRLSCTARNSRFLLYLISRRYCAIICSLQFLVWKKKST